VSALPPRERGCFLTWILLLGMFGNVMYAGFLVLMSVKAKALPEDSFDSAEPGVAYHAARLLQFMAVLALLNGLSLAGIWAWKKWGAYGYGICAFGAALLAFRTSVVSGVGGLAGTGFVMALVISKWSSFE
jgi:hypothetical protein